MRRREFLGVIAAVASSALPARAQQSAMPVIGFLSSGTPTGLEYLTAAFRQGLGEDGLLRELVPNAAVVGALVNRAFPDAEFQSKDLSTYPAARFERRRASGGQDRPASGPPKARS